VKLTKTELFKILKPFHDNDEKYQVLPSRDVSQLMTGFPDSACDMHLVGV
jgi:hypothetical protein